MNARAALLLALAALATGAAASCRSDVAIPDAAGSPSPTVTASASPSPTLTVATPAPTASTVPAGSHPVNACARLLTSTTSGNIAEASATGVFSKGDEVLLLQVQDAAVFPATGNAGQFDLRLVAAVGSTNGHTVLTLSRAPSIAFASDAARSAQICRVPYFSSLTVSGDIVPPFAWDGSTGGVVALRADAVTLTGSIDASFTGFRGGAANGNDGGSNDGSPDCVASAGGAGANKGESIGIYTSATTACRDNKGPGGGGGNASRSGGGGGAGGGAGGAGGSGPGVNLTATNGLGGTALAAPSSRLLFGGAGGGGAGAGVGGSGGSGGGIVLVIAVSITGGGQLISNGAVGTNMMAGQNAGAGAGGGGGTIRVDAPSWAGSIAIASGGDGGSTDSTTAETDGAGGGGGAGRIIAAVATPPALDLSGGAPGNSFGSSGAGPGQPASLQSATPIPLP